MTKIDSKIPEGQLAEKWSNYKAHQKLVNPANKRRLDIIVVGTGLAGASAAASLGEMGFRVFNLTRFTVFSTIQSKVVTTAHVKPTFTVWPRYQTPSLTNV